MMVLQSNYARRANTENTPPQLTSTKSLASRIRNSLHDAARRRRARTNGVTRTTKYTVQQAKIRSEAKSPTNSICFNIPTTPPPGADVEMKDTDPSLSTSGTTSTIPVLLPKELSRPEYREISKEALYAVDPELVDTDPSYLRDSLEEFGHGMLRVLSSIKATPIKDTLPKELVITVQDLSSVFPTHMMAIYGPPPKNGPAGRRRVTLYPVHSLVLAANCAKLPPFPYNSSIPVPRQQGPQEVTVPVRPLCLPSPQTYPQLSSFLYTRRTDLLLNSLLPYSPPTKLEGNPTQLNAFAAKLAGTYTVQALLQLTMTVHGLWQNVCALGIFDDSLWDTMDLAWQVLLTSIACGTGNPSAMLLSQ